MTEKLRGKPKQGRCRRDKVSRNFRNRKDNGDGEATRNMNYASSHWFDYFSSDVFISVEAGRHGVSSVSTHRSRRYPSTYQALSFAGFLPKGAQELVWCQTWINLKEKRQKTNFSHTKSNLMGNYKRPVSQVDETAGPATLGIINILLNNSFMVSVRPSIYGHTRKVAKHGRSVRVGYRNVRLLLLEWQLSYKSSLMALFPRVSCG